MQKELMTTKMIINHNKKDLRQKNYHLQKSASDGTAVTMMCERYEEP
jgi:hypothetical protein